MEAVRARHVSLPTEKRAKNRDKIAGDKAGGEEGGKRKNRLEAGEDGWRRDEPC